MQNNSIVDIYYTYQSYQFYYLSYIYLFQIFIFLLHIYQLYKLLYRIITCILFYNNIIIVIRIFKTCLLSIILMNSIYNYIYIIRLVDNQKDTRS